MQKERFQVRMPKEYAELVKKQAEAEGRSGSNMIAYIVADYYEKMQRKDA